MKETTTSPDHIPTLLEGRGCLPLFLIVWFPVLMPIFNSPLFYYRQDIVYPFSKVINFYVTFFYFLRTSIFVPIIVIYVPFTVINTPSKIHVWGQFSSVIQLVLALTVAKVWFGPEAVQSWK